MNSNFHIWTLTPTDVYKTLTTTPQGISEAEANLRLKQSGYNELPEPQTRPLILRFTDQLTHFMALLLWVAGIVLVKFLKKSGLGCELRLIINVVTVVVCKSMYWEFWR